MDVDITPTKGYPHMYDFVGDKLGGASNPLVLIILTVVIIVYYFVFKYLGSSGSSQGGIPVHSMGMTALEVILWGLFIFLILINGIQYFFNIDIKTSLHNLFTPVPEVDIQVTSDTVAEEPVPEITIEKQVFHVPDNKYTYRQARALCKAYGAKLANYSEIEDAYKSGGEWCGFGWSSDQMALYPTQKSTWDRLQKKKAHKHDCGRPGINGGFIGNERARFGVNCYGYKPKITEEERELMDTETLYPLTPAEKRFEKRVRKYRNRLPEVLISPFNYSKWSQI